jgi:hypothetical protein
LEPSKGKLTANPDVHTSQGIFFTSWAFDEFFIVSGDLAFSHVEEYENDFCCIEKRIKMAQKSIWRFF